jgi:hypothetical protein
VFGETAGTAARTEMTMEVRRSSTDVVGIDPEARGLILVRVQLEPAPDRHWAQIFGGNSAWDAPPGHSFSISMHPPRLSGSTVTLRPPDGDVEKYLDSLDDRIACTNRHYTTVIKPQLDRERQAADQRAAEDAARLDAAKRQIDERDGRDAA